MIYKRRAIFLKSIQQANAKVVQLTESQAMLDDNITMQEYR